jgi:hypothetical protein
VIARRLVRAAKRTLKRLARPLRLRWIDHKRAASVDELRRLLDLRDDLLQLQAIENNYQVQLSIRRDQIEKGHA